MKKNKKIRNVVLVIVIFLLMYLVGQFIGDKIYYSRYYSLSNLSDYENYSKGLNIVDTITIQTKKLDESEYLVYDEIKIKNDFENFVILEESQKTNNSVKYVLYDENSKTKASFWIGTKETNVDVFDSEVLVFNSMDANYEETDVKKFFKKNKITNDVDLIKYLVDTKSKTNSVFTDLQDLKDKYAIHYIASMLYTNLNSITLLDGDLEGYILNYNENVSKIKEVNIIKNNKNYVFTIIGLEYFTDEYINDLLNTIVIK